VLISVSEHTDTCTVQELRVAEIDQDYSSRVSQATEHRAQQGSRGAVEFSDD
jgi:hypothetical protein